MLCALFPVHCDPFCSLELPSPGPLHSTDEEGAQLSCLVWNSGRSVERREPQQKVTGSTVHAVHPVHGP